MNYLLLIISGDSEASTRAGQCQIRGRNQFRHVLVFFYCYFFISLFYLLIPFFYFTVDVPPLPIQVAVSAYLQESLAQSERQKVTYITFIKKKLLLILICSLFFVHFKPNFEAGKLSYPRVCLCVILYCDPVVSFVNMLHIL